MKNIGKVSLARTTESIVTPLENQQLAFFASLIPSNGATDCFEGEGNGFSMSHRIS